MKKKVYRELHKNDEEEEIVMKGKEWEGLREKAIVDENSNEAGKITKSIHKSLLKKTGRKKKND